jgi:hypothetical protein
MKLAKIIFVSLSLLILQSCSQNLKRKIGFSDSGPNEYSVTKNKPLEMPPHFNIEELEKINRSSDSDLKDLNPGQRALIESLNNN